MQTSKLDHAVTWRRHGFTLIEMLVVVLIVAVLIGITVKILGGAARQAAKAETINKMERLKHAIEEYYAEYGQYPPTDKFGYEYPSTNGNFKGAVADAFDPAHGALPESTVFSFGLMSYLLPRVNEDVQGLVDSYPHIFDDGSEWRKFNQRAEDLPRALDAMRRWRPFLDGPPDQIWGVHLVSNQIAGGSHGSVSLPYTNRLITVVDGWDRSFRYVSYPPYQTYKLWSLGPPPVNSNTYMYGHVGH